MTEGSVGLVGMKMVDFCFRSVFGFRIHTIRSANPSEARPCFRG